MADPAPPAAAAAAAAIEHVDVLPSIPGYYTWPGEPPYRGARRRKWRQKQNRRWLAAREKKAQDEAARQAASSTPTTTSSDAPPVPPTAPPRAAPTLSPSERYADAHRRRPATATVFTSPPPTHQGGDGEAQGESRPPTSSAAEASSATTAADILPAATPSPAPPQLPTDSGAGQTAPNDHGATQTPRGPSVAGPPPTPRRPAPAPASIAETPRVPTGRATGTSTFSPTTERAWRRVQHRLESLSTPDRARFLERLADTPCMAASNPSIAERLYGKAKSILRRHQSPAPPTSAPSSNDPIDEDAFEYRHPSRGGTHRLVGQEGNASYNLQASAQRARQRAVQKIVDAIKSCGDPQQIALALRDAVCHRDVRPFFEQVWGSFDPEELRLGKIALKGMKAIADRISTAKIKGMLPKESRAFLGIIGMCLTEADENGEGDGGKKEVPHFSAIKRLVFGSFSQGATYRIMQKAGVKRKRFDEEEVRTFTTVDEEKKRWKYSDEEVKSLRTYLVEGNVHVRQSPKTDDTVSMRDHNGDIVYEADGRPKKRQKVLTALCPREMHNEMCKSKEDGGFEGARDASGNIRFSLSALRSYWPNWLKIMTNADMEMCGCETCTTMKDLHEAMKAKRRKIMASAQRKLYEMDDGPDKVQKQAELDAYRSEILDPNDKHKVDTEWDAAEKWGCGVKHDVTLDGETKAIPHYSCLLGQCQACEEQGYTPPSFEKGYENEMISYTKFTTHARCTAHGAAFLEMFDKKPYARCSECEDLSDEEKKALKAKVQWKKFRTKHTMSLKKFVADDGPYVKQLQKMYSHKYRVILLGSKHKMKTRYRHARLRRNTVKTERDFAERWVPNPNGQAQFEYFNKDESLGMEGIVAFFKPKDKDEFETRVYTVLSTEKSQDGNVVYANTRMILEDIKKLLDDGGELGGISHYPEAVDGAAQKFLLEILDDTDGCSAQYRCGAALFMLHKLAAELDIIYDRAIDCEGHGKKTSDGEGGQNKSALSKEFRGNVEYQPEALDSRKQSVLLYQMEDGQRRDLADLCRDILTRKRAKGAKKVEPNKRRKPNNKSDKSIVERTFYVRKEGTAKWGDIKMKAVGFPSGKSNGVKFHYNFRFEKALGDRFAFRRIACSCDGCYDKLQESIETRYSGPCDKCYLWPIFEKKDGSGTGLNDWGMGHFVPAKECDMATYHAAKADTLRELGKTYAQEIEVGSIGAHAAEDTTYDNFYLVKWDSAPEEAQEDKTVVLDGQSYPLHKGDWYCKGVWLKKLRGGRNWWTMHGQRTIVRLETVVDSNVDILPWSDSNALPASVYGDSRKEAEEKGAWLISDANRNFIMEETRNRTAWEYEEDIIVNVRDELVRDGTWGANENEDGDDDE